MRVTVLGAGYMGSAYKSTDGSYDQTTSNSTYSLGGFINPCIDEPSQTVRRVTGRLVVRTVGRLVRAPHVPSSEDGHPHGPEILLVVGHGEPYQRGDVVLYDNATLGKKNT